MGLLRNEYETDEPHKEVQDHIPHYPLDMARRIVDRSFHHSPNSVNDLSGRVSYIDNEKVWGKMNPFYAAVYFLAISFVLRYQIIHFI